jgi:ketosteroid isomerase-like protein
MAPPSHTTELVEEAYRTWNASGPGAFLELTTDTIELHDAPELPDAQVWVGREAVLARLEDVAAAIGGRWADIDDVRSAGDEILVSLTWRLDRASSTPLASLYHVVSVDGDRIARVRVFLDEDAAARAALAGRGG